jgi:hypothetical protein
MFVLKRGETGVFCLVINKARYFFWNFTDSIAGQALVGIFKVASPQISASNCRCCELLEQERYFYHFSHLSHLK